MKTVKVEIQGISPLLMNRPDLLDLSEKSKQRLAGKEKLKEEFETKQYRDANGALYSPETHLKGAIMEAGKKIKVKGSGKATYSKIFGYSVFIHPANILHKRDKLKEHICLAVNPSTKGRIPLCRPMLEEWGLNFEIEYDEDEIPFEVLKDALDIAGKKVGIGDWRPSMKGSYGRFVVTEFKEAK